MNLSKLFRSIALFTLIIALLICASACGKKDAKSDETENGSWKLSVKYRCLPDGTKTVVGQNSYDDAGNLVKRVSAFERYGFSTRTEEYEYDKNGNLVRQVTYLDDTLYGEKTCSYSSYGMIETVDQYEQGTFYMRTVSEIDPDGVILSCRLYNHAKELVSESVYRADGKPLETKKYDSEGKILSRTEWSIDDETGLLFEREYDADGNLQKQRKVQYDADGRKLFEYLSDGSGTVTWRYEGVFRDYGPDIGIKFMGYYEYDANGEIARCAVIERDADGRATKRIEYLGDRVQRETTYSYKEDGTVTEDESTYNDQGDTVSRSITSKDSNERVIQDISYGADGKLVQWVEKEYDAEGRVVKQAEFLSKGVLDSWYEIEYTDSGDVLSRTDYDGNGMVTKRQTKEFDEHGNCVKECYYGPDGELTEWYEYVYVLIPDP